MMATFVAAMTGLSGCYEGLDALESDPEESPGSTEGGADGQGTDEDDVTVPAGVTARRLTRRELRRTLRDLTGAEIDTESLLPGEERVGPFSNNAQALTFPQVFAEGMVAIAKQASAHVVAQLEASGECAGALDDACAQAVLAQWLPRAWRRSVTDEEHERILAVYERGRDNEGPAHGLELALQAVLVSAPFVYRIEHGQPDPAGGWRPTSEEMAVRLSYLVWGTMPDDALMELGRSGALTDPEQILAQAQRMLDDPRAHEALAEFHYQWLGLDALETVDKDLERFTHWDPQMPERMATETRLFLDEVAFSGQIDDLFVGRFTYVDSMLAALYELDLVPSSDFTRVTLPEQGPRAGLLTQGAFLAMNADFSVTAPVRRGAFVRERLLCDELPPPPPTVDDTVPEPSTATTTREQYQEHLTDPSCRACHDLMDPIGLGFEHFDATGKYRQQHNALPIDATGYVQGTSIDFFDGAVALSEALAGEPRPVECLARSFAAYAYGGTGESETDPSVERLVEVALDQRTHRALVLATVTTPRFLGLDKELP